MKVKILNEEGYYQAMYGLSLSYNKKVEEVEDVAIKLAGLDKGHNKFLESMVVWIEVQAPLDFHIQLDTYRVGMTKQSQSTMHTLKKRALRQEDFEIEIPQYYLDYLNSIIDSGLPVTYIKKLLPCGFLQTRVLCTNYKTIRNIIIQRQNHKLLEWKVFCEAMKALKYYNLLGLKDDKSQAIK